MAPMHLALAWKWSIKHGFLGGVLYWLNSFRQDPVMASAVIDFCVLIAILGMYLLSRIPNADRRGVAFYLGCVLYVVWPSLGFMIYLLKYENTAQR